MSLYGEMVTRNTANGDPEANCMVQFSDQWPNVCQALTGILDGDGRWLVGPATIMVWVEGDKMKFCLSPKFTAKVCFGCISDPTHILDGIEHALTTGACEWKARGGGKRS